jgi:hypothetical protein
MDPLVMAPLVMDPLVMTPLSLIWTISSVPFGSTVCGLENIVSYYIYIRKCNLSEVSLTRRLCIMKLW